MAAPRMLLWEQLFRVKQHQIRMMQRRGFTVPDAALLTYSFAQFEAYYKNVLASLPTAGTGEAPIDLFDVLVTEIEQPHKALVWYTPSQSRDVPVDDIRKLIEYITEDDGHLRRYRTIIIVSFGGLASKVHPQLEVLEKCSWLLLQHFTYQELSYDPTHHFLVPPHRRMPPRMIPVWLKRTRYETSQLPTILVSDPIVKYHGWCVGDIVIIMRNIPYYRRVVPAPARNEK